MNNPLVQQRRTSNRRTRSLRESIGHLDIFFILFVLAFVYCVISTIVSAFTPLKSASFIATVCLGFAVCRIRILGQLKEQVDRFEKENAQFKAGNAQLKASVDNMHEETVNLQSTNAELSKSIGQLEEVQGALQKFAISTGNDIQQLMTTLQSSIREQRTIQKNSVEIQARTKRLALQQEKAMLMNLFFQVQNEDEEKGLSPEEFQSFIDMLPCESVERVRGMLGNFTSNDLNGDGKISIKEFKRGILQSAESISGESSDRHALGMTEP